MIDILLVAILFCYQDAEKWTADEIKIYAQLVQEEICALPATTTDFIEERWCAQRQEARLRQKRQAVEGRH